MTAPSTAEHSENSECSECNRLKSVNCTLRLNLQKMKSKTVETAKLVNLFKKQKAQYAKTKEELDKVKLENENLTDQLRFQLEKQPRKNVLEKTGAEYEEECQQYKLQIAELENMTKQLKLKLSSIQSDSPVSKVAHEKLVADHDKLMGEHANCKVKIAGIRETEHRLRASLVKVTTLEKKVASIQSNLTKANEKITSQKLQHKVDIMKLRQSLKDSKRDVQQLKSKLSDSTKQATAKPQPLTISRVPKQKPEESAKGDRIELHALRQSLEDSQREVQQLKSKLSDEMKLMREPKPQLLIISKAPQSNTVIDNVDLLDESAHATTPFSGSTCQLATARRSLNSSDTIITPTSPHPRKPKNTESDDNSDDGGYDNNNSNNNNSNNNNSSNNNSNNNNNSKNNNNYRNSINDSKDEAMDTSSSEVAANNEVKSYVEETCEASCLHIDNLVHSDQPLSGKPLSPASEEMVKNLKALRPATERLRSKLARKSASSQNRISEPLRISTYQSSITQPFVSQRKRKREAPPHTSGIADDLKGMHLGLCSESSLLADLQIGELTLRDLGVEDNNNDQIGLSKRVKNKENVARPEGKIQDGEELVDSLLRLKDDSKVLKEVIKSVHDKVYGLYEIISATTDACKRLCGKNTNTRRSFDYFPLFEQKLSCLLVTWAKTADREENSATNLIRKLCTAIITIIQGSKLDEMRRCSPVAMLCRICTAVARSSGLLMAMRLCCGDFIIAGIHDPMMFSCVAAVWPEVFSLPTTANNKAEDVTSFDDPNDTFVYALILMVSISQKDKKSSWTSTTSKERRWFRKRCGLSSVTDEANRLEQMGGVLATKLLTPTLKSPHFIEATTLRLIFAQQGYAWSYQCIVKHIWPLVKSWRTSSIAKMSPSEADEIISFAVTLIGDGHNLGLRAIVQDEEKEQHLKTMKFLVTSLEKILCHSTFSNIITLPIAHTLVNVLLSMGATENSSSPVVQWCKQLSDRERHMLPPHLKEKISLLIAERSAAT